MRHGVLVALLGDLEQGLVAAVDRTDELVVVRRCADVAELLAAAMAGLGVVAVVDAELQPDRPLVSRLAQAGTSTVVVCDPRDRDRFREIGAIPVDGGAAEIVAAVRAAASATPVPVSIDGDGVGVEAGAGGADAVAPTRGGMIVVWGAHGAPGRTTIAVNLAAEIAAAGATTLLDADVWGSSVAISLGLLEESAGLAAAVRAADQGTLDATSLRRLCTRVNDRLLVLPGLPRASRWREVSGGGVDAVWEPSRRLADWVVVEAGTWVADDDRGAGFGAVLGQRRNAVTESAMVAADVLVVVGAAEPVGIQRLVQTLLDLDGRDGLPARRQVVVTRVRADAAGPRPADSVREALHRFAGVDDVLLVPDDRVACDRAGLAGASLAEVAPRSPARAAITDLATTLTGLGAGGARTRRRRVPTRTA